MFFVLSKIFWALIQPLNALCLLGLAGFVAKARWKNCGQRMINAAFVLILVCGLLPLGPWLVTTLERAYPTPAAIPDKIDGIILLGGAFDTYLSQQSGHLVANDQVDRFFCFVDLAKQHPEARLVFTGGSGDIVNPGAVESDDAKTFFRLAGLDEAKVIYEDRSRNTYENAIFSKDVVRPAAGQTWVLSTSAYHMPRAMGIFEKTGWPMIPYQCDPKTDGTYRLFTRTPNIAANYGMLNIAVKEYIGALVYYLTGKTAFILPPGRIRSDES